MHANLLSIASYMSLYFRGISKEVQTLTSGEPPYTYRTIYSTTVEMPLDRKDEQEDSNINPPSYTLMSVDQKVAIAS